MKCKDIEKNMDRLLKDTKSVLIATDNGIGIEGDLVHILGAYGMLTHQLLESGIDKDFLKHAFEVGMGDDTEDDDKEKRKKAKMQLKEALRELSKDLEKMLGDE